MANIPLLLTLANDLNRVSLAASPFYETPLSYLRTPHRLALLGTEPVQQQLLSHEKHSKAGHQVSTIGKNGFQVCMDIQQFKPSELNVKALDNCVVIEGKHEEREDEHGFISRHFVRRYALPKGYDSNKVVATLSSDGVLTINVPKPQIEDKSSGRQIPIQQVGPAHLNVKVNAKEQIDDEKEKDGHKEITSQKDL